MSGTSRTSPGPLPWPPGLRIARVLRPSRKMTARSYSRRIFANEPMKKMTAKTTTRISSESTEIMGLLPWRSEEHTSELQSQSNLVCRLLLEKKKNHEQPHDPSSPLRSDVHVTNYYLLYRRPLELPPPSRLRQHAP